MPEHLPAARLTADVRHNLFLAVKEALNNVVKHAEAREVWLRLIQDGSRVTLVIEDDGHGFGGLAAAPPPGARAPSGQGLDNLVSRLAAIGGRCSISSQPGRGPGRTERRNRVISDPCIRWLAVLQFGCSVARLLGRSWSSVYSVCSVAR